MEQYAFWFLVLFAIVVCVILFGPSATVAFLASIFNFFMSLANVLGPWILGISVLCVVIWLFSRYHKNSKLEQDDYHVNTPQSGKRKQKKVTHKEPSNKTGQRSGEKKSSSKKTSGSKANGSSKKKS